MKKPSANDVMNAAGFIVGLITLGGTVVNAVFGPKATKENQLKAQQERDAFKQEIIKELSEGKK